MHALELIEHGADFQMRETYESAIASGFALRARGDYQVTSPRAMVSLDATSLWPARTASTRS